MHIHTSVLCIMYIDLGKKKLVGGGIDSLFYDHLDWRIDNGEINAILQNR